MSTLAIDEALLDEDIIVEWSGIAGGNAPRGIGPKIFKFGQYGQQPGGDGYPQTFDGLSTLSPGGNTYYPYTSPNGYISVSDQPKLQCQASIRRLVGQMGYVGFFESTSSVIPNNYKTGYGSTAMFGFEYADEVTGQVWCCMGGVGAGVIRTSSGVTPSIFPAFDLLEVQLKPTSIDYYINDVLVLSDTTNLPPNMQLRWGQISYWQAGWAAYPKFYVGPIMTERNRRQ